jgi:hypothetical protein
MKSTTIPTPEDSELRQKAWLALNQCLPPRDADSNFWWQLTGRQLAALVEAAGYPIEKQYEVLMIHYHWTVRTGTHEIFYIYYFINC